MRAAIITVVTILVLAAAGLSYWFVFRKDNAGKIIVPYIAHQKPRIDPHVPSSVPIADKLDEAVFDGLFNVSANASGITYEDGLGELMGLPDKSGVVTIRLKPAMRWHSSWKATMEKEEIAVAGATEALFTAADLRFSLRRIQALGSMSPDYILVSQAVPTFDFAGPDQNGEIKLQFGTDRTWTESDIKEVLSFKVLPQTSEMNAANYTIGTGPYLYCGEYEDIVHFQKKPDGAAMVPDLVLRPFIDNSTYTTELRNRNINALLSTPFGSISPILADSTRYFHKSSIATCFFALFHNTQRLSLEKRQALRKMVNGQLIMSRFFKTGSPQQRHIANYKGDGDNYDEYLNKSVFPTTSYYVEEQLVVPPSELAGPDPSVLTDTVRIQTCLNYDFREELSDLVEIMNDPALFHGKVKVSAVSNEEIATGNYDAVLVPITGYRSNFLFDLYNIFLREPDFSAYRINLKTVVDAKTGKPKADASSLAGSRNFFRADLAAASPEQADLQQLLDYVYGFMSTSEIGDKQQYSRLIDELEQKLALGTWLFSLPSLAYFSTQFDARTVDLYGTASQLSTVEKWQEDPARKRRW